MCNLQVCTFAHSIQTTRREYNQGCEYTDDGDSFVDDDDFRVSSQPHHLIPLNLMIRRGRQFKRILTENCFGFFSVNIPLSYFSDSPEKYSRAKLPIFPEYVNGRLETTFRGQITFGVFRRGQKWSKLPQFHKGG